MDPHRSERLSRALQDSLQEILNFELEDPRLRPLDVAAVELSPDARTAVIRIEVRGTAEEAEGVLSVLSQAKGFIRRQVAATIDVYRVPDLRFEAASSAGSPGRIQGLLKRMRRGRAKDS